MKKLLASLLLGLGLMASVPLALAQAPESAAAPSAVAAPAETAAPAPAAAPLQAADAVSAEAAPAAAPAPKLDSGDTAWMLTSTLLVILMTIPGLALFYGGLARSKNMLSVLVQVFVVFSLISVLWALFGYSFTFGGEGLFIGGADKLFLKGIAPDTLSAVLPTIPEYVFVAFQGTFAAITVALIVGAFAERIRFSAVLIFSVLWFAFSYIPMAHMVWGGGLLSGSENSLAAMIFGSTDGEANVAPIDFAGGTVVHINAGIAALVLALVVGKRKGFGKQAFRPHNIPFVMLGAALLWFGWFGFNAGSAFTADGAAGLAWVNTTSATAAAILGWIITEKVRFGHMTALGAASGVVAGLVAAGGVQRAQRAAAARPAA
mgnify:CR=1 FL=1